MGFEWLPFGFDVSTRLYDYWVTRGAPFVKEDFIRLYSKALRQNIDLVPDVSRLSHPQLQEGATALLTCLAAIVQAYHGNDPGIRVNANYMIPVASSDELVGRALFTRRDRRADAFLCFLHLEGWAERDANVPPDVFLPVEHAQAATSDPLLFGAPRAFQTNEPQLINDTEDLVEELTHAMHPNVQREIVEFFERQRARFRSFASLPITAPPGLRHTGAHRVVAVVNIDSNRTFLFGKNKANQTKLRMVLEPITHVLSYFLVKLHFGLAAN